MGTGGNDSFRWVHKGVGTCWKLEKKIIGENISDFFFCITGYLYQAIVVMFPMNMRCVLELWLEIMSRFVFSITLILCFLKHRIRIIHVFWDPPLEFIQYPIPSYTIESNPVRAYHKLNTGNLQVQLDISQRNQKLSLQSHSPKQQQARYAHSSYDIS